MFVEGVHAFFIESDPAAVSLLSRAKEGFHHLGQLGDHHMATLLWATAAALLADASDAEAATSEFLTLTKTQGTSLGYTFALWNRGLTELRHGQPHQAADLFRDALHKREINDHWGPNWFVETLAWATAAHGDHHHAAATLLGTAHRMRHLTGHTITGIHPLHAYHIQTEHHLIQALGTHAYNAAHQQGAALPTYRDAITQALTNYS